MRGIAASAYYLMCSAPPPPSMCDAAAGDWPLLQRQRVSFPATHNKLPETLGFLLLRYGLLSADILYNIISVWPINSTDWVRFYFPFCYFCLSILTLSLRGFFSCYRSIVFMLCCYSLYPQMSQGFGDRGMSATGNCRHLSCRSCDTPLPDGSDYYFCTTCRSNNCLVEEQQSLLDREVMLWIYP